MNISRINKLALCGAVVMMLSACESGQLRPYGKRPNNPQKITPQQIDECPAADGKWNLPGSGTLEFGRSEGYLKLDHPELSESVVFDGQARKIATKEGVTPEVTATCSGQIMYINYKYDGKTVKQTWNVDLEKDILGLVEAEGDVKKAAVFGSRIYEKVAKVETPVKEEAQEQAAPATETAPQGRKRAIEEF